MDRYTSQKRKSDTLTNIVQESLRSIEQKLESMNTHIRVLVVTIWFFASMFVYWLFSGGSL